MWPDIYLEAAPKLLRPLVRAALRSDFRMTRAAFRSATAITAHAPGFVDWALGYAGRSTSERDRDFPFAYPGEPPGDAALAEATRFWQAQGLCSGPDEFLICFFGTFAERREVDVTTVIEAAGLLQNRLPRVKFVLCGSGPTLKRCRSLARNLSNVLMPGWMDAPRIWSLMRHSHVGLLPYLPSVDFRASVPNKAIEYLSAGLPILTCLRGGYLESVLQTAGCGIFYVAQAPESLAHAVTQICSDPVRLRTQRGAAGRLFNDRFREDVVCAAMADHLTGLVLDARSASGAASVHPVP